MWQKIGDSFWFLRGKWEYPGVCLHTFQREYGGRKEGFPIDPRKPFEQNYNENFINKPSTIKNQDFINDGLLSVF